MKEKGFGLGHKIRNITKREKRRRTEINCKNLKKTCQCIEARQRRLVGKKFIDDLIQFFEGKLI